MSRYVKISTIGAAGMRSRPSVNQEAVDRMIEYWKGRFAQVLPDRPDLILVPECCDRYWGHTLQEYQDYYRLRGHQIGDFFAAVARENHCYVAYPAARAMEDGTWRNSVELFDRDGRSMGFYDKNYPVTTETTESGVLAGRRAPLFACDFGRVGCAICFDLNFDGIRRRYVESRPEVILFASMYHGGLMQGYWAYSCRAHLVTAVCGEPSGVLSPVGEVLASSTNYFDFVTTRVNLDCEVVHLDFNQDKLRAAKDKYGPGVTVHDPGFLGAVLLSSEMEDKTCDELIAEFDIERLDDYMARSAAHAEDPRNQEPE